MNIRSSLSLAIFFCTLFRRKTPNPVTFQFIQFTMDTAFPIFAIVFTFGIVRSTKAFRKSKKEKEKKQKKKETSTDTIKFNFGKLMNWLTFFNFDWFLSFSSFRPNFQCYGERDVSLDWKPIENFYRPITWFNRKLRRDGKKQNPFAWEVNI